MNILAIAYACEPHRGSEPGVGWNWVKMIASHKNTSITVLTRANNKPVIDQYLEKNDDMKATFIYYDLPKKVLKYKHGDRGIKFFYTLWQKGAVKYLKKNIDLSAFDLVWDFNFGSLNLPSFTYQLKKHYIIGPVSTKKKMPKAYIKVLPFGTKIKYLLQQSLKEHIWVNPIVWKTLKKSDKILLCNEMSREFLPKNQQKNAEVVFHNGIEAEKYPKINIEENSRKLQIIYAGRLIESKNIETAIEALKLVKAKGKEFEFDIYGKGKLKKKLQKMVQNYHLENEVKFHEKITQKELFEEYQKKELFLFPSLLEISSTSVMEAMYYGLLPICLDIRCMEFIYKESPIIIVPCKSPTQDAEAIAEELLKIDLEEISKRRLQSRKKAEKEFLWETRQKSVDKLLERIV